MTISIEDIRSVASEVKISRSSFSKKLDEFKNSLSEALGDIDINGKSGLLELESTGPDDWLYGYIYYRAGELKIYYRSTWDDQEDVISSTPEEYREYRVYELNQCPINWLEKVASEKPLNDLLADIYAELSHFQNNSRTSIKALSSTLESQSKMLSDDLSEELKGLDSSKLLSDWSKARNLIHSEPSESITRTSSFLESLCRLILEELSIPLPQTITISSLIQAVSNAIKLSEDSEANNDLTQLVGGVKSIFKAVGSMRTHFGTAHGSSPGDYEIDEHYARLANNAAACVSIFIIQRYKKYKQNRIKNS